MLLLVSQKLKRVVKRVIPPAVYRPILAGWRQRRIRFGALRRLEPVSCLFGFDRGQPIDRYYIETFLQSHRDEISGRVLEIGDAGYTHKFEGDRVTRSDVLHVVPGNPQANLVGDLATGENIPQDAFNCLILTQLFNVIYDVKGAITNCYRALKPGGVLLATFPGISQVSRYDMDRWGDYWRFTDASARELFGDVFGPKNVTVETRGNVLVACAFLQGLATRELKQTELEYHDPDYQLLITVRAIKPKVLV